MQSKLIKCLVFRRVDMDTATNSLPPLSPIETVDLTQTDETVSTLTLCVYLPVYANN